MEKIQVIKNTLQDLKLEDIIIYDMRGKSPFFDYFILSTATNKRQLQAATKHLKDDLSEHNFSLPLVEGTESGTWLLADCKDIIVNVFTRDEREYYNIEKMWLDIPQIDINSL